MDEIIIYSQILPILSLKITQYLNFLGVGGREIYKILFIRLKYLKVDHLFYKCIHSVLIHYSELTYIK